MVGNEITIGEETFNVISVTDTTFTMLAQYALGFDYKQDSSTTYATNIHDEGMYWSEWVNSSFNTAGYVIEQDACNFKVMLPDSPSYIVNDDSMADSIIVANKEYTRYTLGVWVC